MNSVHTRAITEHWMSDVDNMRWVFCFSWEADRDLEVEVFIRSAIYPLVCKMRRKNGRVGKLGSCFNIHFALFMVS